MSNTPDTPLGNMYDAHIRFILSKNVEGLLSQYTDDCVLISTLTDDRKPIYVRGHKELEQFFRSRIFALQDMDINLTQWAEDKNSLMIVEHIKTTGVDGAKGEVHFYDNWYLRDGKIAVHFAGVVRYPDGSYADDSRPKSEPPENTPLGKLYREHIAFIKEKNVNGILNQYAVDALLIGTLTEGRKPRFVRGREQLRDFFTGNFMGLKALEAKIDQWAEIENGLMIVESIKVTDMDDNIAELSFYDNWILENGRILIHYAGVIRYPDGSYS